MKEFDLIIVGAGAAGLRAAITAVRKNLRVAVISKVHPLRSQSVVASGGLNAVVENRNGKNGETAGDRDSIQTHMKDTLDCGYGFSDIPALETLVRRAPSVIKDLERWGCLFTMESNGSYALRRMGASSFPRTFFAADKTGLALMHTLFEQCIRLRQNKDVQLRFFEEWLVLKLLVLNNTVYGVIAMDIISGNIELLSAKSVIWASGGFGRIYGRSSNATINSGWGLAVPYYAGLPLKDMEFVQFHPTQLSGSHILISEAARSEGALLLNRKGERFLSSYDDTKEAMELSPRDRISRNIRREILAGRAVDASCVHLDLRHIGAKKIQERLPGIRNLCKTFAGLDPLRYPIPVTPGQHYMIGGIDTNERAETAVKGFYAAGECANTGVHGANRMGGNSLLEALVFGEIAAESAASYIRKKHIKTPGNTYYINVFTEEKKRIENLLKQKGNVSIADIREKLQRTMDEKAGIYRDGMGLVEASRTLWELNNMYKADLKLDGRETRVNYSLINAIELKGSLDIADAVIQAALKRNESIGVHFRNDFPNFGGRPRHSLLSLWKGKIRIRFVPVNTNEVPGIKGLWSRL
ncbi:MAG: FAD-binding protein [Candidatus Marinimicrobia bacterium]|jgi:succinate dehydrogenase / fumarate reductase flavoprotein subunit|nr:FAD-binding protein [Candidatus Neomarinimicrobiota bacterium]MDD5708955.1 FAD-binding protein [Candidatus Neomarinimicrobiota bacterium]MDX9777952.1 FAD-binding protein [bacterium]